MYIHVHVHVKVHKTVLTFIDSRSLEGTCMLHVHLKLCVHMYKYTLMYMYVLNVQVHK